METFKIIYEISSYSKLFFNISPQTENLQSRWISKTKSTNQFLLIEKCIFGTNCLIRSKTTIVWKMFRLNWRL